mgnify:CR=1 FL=1
MSQNSNQIVLELSKLLNIDQLDEATLQLCIKLLDEGVDPEMLATKIIQLKKEISN